VSKKENSLTAAVMGCREGEEALSVESTAVNLQTYADENIDSMNPLYSATGS
jgi:hypothetical protein